MGLTIHYSLKSSARALDESRELIRQLRQRAMTLPFERVGDLVELTGIACDFQQTDHNDPNRWLLVQAGRDIEVEGYSYAVPPKQMIAFSTAPGEGCEPANFGLCCFPRTIPTRERQRYPSGAPAGWSWQSFCKTQYASNPDLGGIESFLKCHLSVVRLLDVAAELGLGPQIHDESGYWEHRSVERLVGEVERWNQAMAGFVGQLKDQLGGSKELQSEITQFPDYEHLEAKGRAGESTNQESVE